jgi:hypothetical protein
MRWQKSARGNEVERRDQGTIEETQGGRCIARCTHCVHVGALVLGSVGGVAESFGAAGVLALVRPFTRVGAEVDLEVLQAREGLFAPFELKLLKSSNC